MEARFFNLKRGNKEKPSPNIILSGEIRTEQRYKQLHTLKETVCSQIPGNLNYQIKQKANNSQNVTESRVATTTSYIQPKVGKIVNKQEIVIHTQGEKNKQSIETNSMQAQMLGLKIGKRFEQTLHKKRYQIGQHTLEMVLNIIVLKKMQIKNTLRYFILCKMPNQRLRIPNISKIVKQLSDVVRV